MQSASLIVLAIDMNENLETLTIKKISQFLLDIEVVFHLSIPMILIKINDLKDSISYLKKHLVISYSIVFYYYLETYLVR